MTLLIGALTVGLLLSLLALGVYISFRVFEFPDITADGTFAFGAAVAAGADGDDRHGDCDDDGRAAAADAAGARGERAGADADGAAKER